jgi:hypothetical protein
MSNTIHANSQACQEQEGVSSTGQVSDSRVASAAGECTAETGIEVDSPAEMTASTGEEPYFPIMIVHPSISLISRVLLTFFLSRLTSNVFSGKDKLPTVTFILASEEEIFR